ncbi:MAG: DUF4173 domain-containing protein [Oscillospiraceae bacterium]|nr:DUF4173 domain-containing protein [Oscillospiraceae bacterium]
MENEELYLNTKAQAPADQPKIPLYQAVFAWGTFALGFIFTHFAAPYFGGVWGGIFIAAFGIFIAIYARKSGVKMTGSHIVMLSAAELFCLTPLFSANRLVCFAAAVYSFALYLYLLSAMSGADAFGRHFVMDFLRSVFVRPFAGFTRQPVSALSLFKGKGRSRNVLYAFLGLLLALPLTIVVVVLLMDSDETFKNVMSGFSELLPNLSFSIVGEILFAIPIAMYIFGALFSVKEPAHEYFGGAPEYRFLPPVLSYFAVSPICVFYLIYVIVQIGNIADAFGNNIGYAEFARRGFFELCAISVINLGVIILLQTFSKRKENDKKPLALRVYSIIIPAFTLMIIATALTKMFMYIGEYGMTQLRIYTSWFMMLLAVIFALIIALQIKEYRIWKALFVSFMILFAALCFGNFDGNIAAYNINAYRSGNIEKLDVDAFEELGTAAVAPAYELYCKCDDPELSEKLKSFIVNEGAADALRPGFAYFSVPRAMAQNAFSELYSSDVIKVSVEIDCKDIDEITAEYIVGGELRGGQSISNARGDVFKRGETVTFNFRKQDFKSFDDLSKQSFGIYFRLKEHGDSTEFYPDIPQYSGALPDDCDTERYSRAQGDNSNSELDGTVWWEWNAEFDSVYNFVLRETEGGKYALYPIN